MCIYNVAAEKDEKEQEMTERRAASRLTRAALRTGLSLREMIELGKWPYTIHSDTDRYLVMSSIFRGVLQYVLSPTHHSPTYKRCWTLHLRVQPPFAGETGERGGRGKRRGSERNQ